MVTIDEIEDPVMVVEKKALPSQKVNVPKVPEPEPEPEPRLKQKRKRKKRSTPPPSPSEISSESDDDMSYASSVLAGAALTSVALPQTHRSSYNLYAIFGVSMGVLCLGGAAVYVYKRMQSMETRLQELSLQATLIEPEPKEDAPPPKKETDNVPTPPVVVTTNTKPRVSRAPDADPAPPISLDDLLAQDL